LRSVQHDDVPVEAEISMLCMRSDSLAVLTSLLEHARQTIKRLRRRTIVRRSYKQMSACVKAHSRYTMTYKRRYCLDEDSFEQEYSGIGEVKEVPPWQELEDALRMQPVRAYS
jgi:hypothetical protein